MTSMPKLVTAVDELADDVDEYAAYIRQVTGDGEAIVDCLIRIMEDDSVGAKPYERLDAQLLLDAIGFGRLAVDQASIIPPAGAVPASPTTPAAPGPPRPANARQPRRPVLLLSEETLFRLPPLVRQKTDGGRKMADFLTAVVKGELSDFRPHHWIRAAKHLAARAYSREIDPDPELPGLSVQDTMTLIDKLTAAFQERKTVARPGPKTLDDPDAAIDCPDDDAGESRSTAPAHPTLPRDGRLSPYTRTSVLDHDYLPRCPDGVHLFEECQCAEDRDELLLDHLRRSPDHPP